MSPLVEDFSDVADYVQEDNSYVEQNASEDEVERKIAEEHAKYKEAQAKRQEEVRASRPWSAPPVDSPRPEQQKEREKERQARGSIGDAAALEAPREEYEPPARPYLLQAQASGSNVAYLSRPQSAEQRSSANRLLSGRQSRASLSGIEEDAGEGTAANSRQHSALGRLGSNLGERPSNTGAPPDDAPGRDQYGMIKEDEDEGDFIPPIASPEESAAVLPAEEQEAQDEGADGDAQQDGGQGEREEDEEETTDPRVVEPSAEEVAEYDGGPSYGGVGAEPSGGGYDSDGGDGRVLVASVKGSLGGLQQHTPSNRSSALGVGAGGQDDGHWGQEDEAAPEEQEPQQQQEETRASGGLPGDDGMSTTRGSQYGGRYDRSGAPSVAASTTTLAMAMRGFVEPLPYERSQSPAKGVEEGRDEGASDREADEEDDDEGYEDSFEDDEEMEEDSGNSAGAEAEDTEQTTGERQLSSAEPSSARNPLSRAPSVRSRVAPSLRGALSKEPSRAMSPMPPPGAGHDDEDDVPTAPPSISSFPPLARVNSGAGPDALGTPSRTTPLAASNSQRSVSSGGGGAAAATAAPQQFVQGSLLPPQQFALQLLKHDIDVLPQHHRAAAEAALARRKSASARPAGAGLAAFGYLGYHVAGDNLTAPSGPAFRSASPGRASSPGRGNDAATGLVATSSLKAVRPAGVLQENSVGAVGRGGRPISAPHIRPNAARGDVDDGGAAAAAAAVAPPDDGFIGMAREMRVARLLPPVVPQPARSGRGSSGGGARPSEHDGLAPHPERSMSVLDEQEVNAAQSRIKFDVWLDALGGKVAPAAASSGPKQSSNGGGDLGMPSDGASRGRRPPRPMTAPATGRRRPVSARPIIGNGMYGLQQPVVSVPKPMGRPLSAQPHQLRPASASRGGVAAMYADFSLDAPMSAAVPPLEPAPPAGVTAAVEVGGVTVSVYVADTLKRIVEANRWLQQLGVSAKRYRLKDRLSNMTIQLCEELPPLPSEKGMYDPYDGGAVAVVKELTLKQFLSGHAKLKQQAKKLRQVATPPLPPGMSVGGGGYGPMDYSGGGSRAYRPFSATGGGGANGGGGSRIRPASAVVSHSSIRLTATSAGGAEPKSYTGDAIGASGGGGVMAHQGYQPGRPVRPSSANPAYGRTPTFNTYNGGSSPPAGSGTHGFTLSAYPMPGSSGGGARQQPPRAAWGNGNAAGGGGGSGGGSHPVHHQNYTITGNSGGGGGLPYIIRSVSATARIPADIEDEEDADPAAMLVEPDERGDVSRAVRQQLGGAADYCQARRHEIARLRNMSLA